MYRALIAGGGAPEIEVAVRLMEYAHTLRGMEAYCVRGFAEAMEVIPSTLAENAGLNPIGVVTELRKCHANGQTTAGINVRRVSGEGGGWGEGMECRKGGRRYGVKGWSVGREEGGMG